VAKILMFRIDGGRQVAVHPPPEHRSGEMLKFPSRCRVVAADSDFEAIARMFPEAWRPFIVLPGATMMHV
jgi:hypothetical protein